MKVHKLLRSFVAGMVFPATILPLIYTVGFLLEPNSIQSAHVQFFALYIPILFGITNIISIKTKYTKNFHLWVIGICLGLVVASIGVFELYLPQRILGITDSLQYVPLIVVPIIYGAIFRYIVKWLNKELQQH